MSNMATSGLGKWAAGRSLGAGGAVTAKGHGPVKVPKKGDTFYHNRSGECTVVSADAEMVTLKMQSGSTVNIQTWIFNDLVSRGADNGGYDTEEQRKKQFAEFTKQMASRKKA